MRCLGKNKPFAPFENQFHLEFYCIGTPLSKVNQKNDKSKTNRFFGGLAGTTFPHI